MLRVHILFVLLLFPVDALSRETISPPTQWVHIRVWQGEQLTLETELGIHPGHAQIFYTSDEGPRVPEGMVPPPVRLETLVTIDAGQQGVPLHDDHDFFVQAMRLAQRFTLGTNDVYIYSLIGDRVDVVLYDETAEAIKVVLPNALQRDMSEKGWPQHGVPIAWFSGSLRPATEAVYLDPPKEPAHVTLHDGDPLIPEATK